MISAPSPSRVASGASNHSAVWLLIALGFLMVSMPLVNALSDGDLIESVLLTIVMFFSVRAVGSRRRTHLIAMVLLVPPMLAKWINHFRPDLISPLFYIVGAILFFGFVVAHLLRFIVQSPQVDGNVLSAGVSGYLLLGWLWIPVYLLVARLDHSAFNMPPGSVMNGFSAFYFSFITLCTVGYGDISPVSSVARMLAVVEAITGLFYMAVLVSRLVSMHSSNHSILNDKDSNAP